MKWWPFIRQFPKFALTTAIIVGSTALFCLWWFFHSSRHGGHSRPVEDIRPKLALIESKPYRLLLVDNDLYDVDNGKLIFRNYLADGLPARLYFDASSTKLIARYERGFVRYTLDGREEARLTEATKPAFSNDLRWAVFAKNKEVWRADVDWNSFKFINERKVTSIEQFNEANFADNIVLLAERTLVVRNFSALLRVNLDTGSVKPMRIPLGDIGKRRSPDSKWVVGTSNGQFYCYDVDADEAKTISIGRAAISDFQWLGNDKCLGLMAGKAVVAYDRLTNSLTEVALLPFSCFKMGERSPDSRFIFAAGGIDGRNGALVDLEKKTAVRVIGGAGVAWVSNDTFAFSREVPNTDLRGTWLQTAGKVERRVWPEPYLVSIAGPQLLALPSAGLIVLETGRAISKMKADGAGMAEMLELSRPATRVTGIEKWKFD